MTKTAETTPKKRAAAPRRAPSLDTTRLRSLAQVIEDLRLTRQIDLVHRLETEEGAKIGEKRGVHTVKLAGITETGDTLGLALQNWGMAARRASEG